MYCVARKKNPNITKNARVMTPLPMLNRRLRKKVSGSIGCGARSSQAMNDVSAVIAMANAPSTGVDVQPSSPPWMMPNTRVLKPTSDSSAPTGSSGVFSSSIDSGANFQMTNQVSATSGRLTSTAAPHQNDSSNAPETTGPSAAPAPAKPAQIAIARGRSAGGKIVVMIDNVAGMTNAAPTPITARPAMTCVAPDARPANNAPRPDTTRPLRSAFLRPNRSPSAPAVNSTPAKTTA